jgi:hypothetical protein
MKANNNKYPEHKYSKYIDPGMSFSNIVSYPSKSELVDALKNARCDGGIMLEPRLQEYLKKKKYYKENNITPCVSLESEFMITNVDVKVLRAFLSGARNMYAPKNVAFSEFNDETTTHKAQFPSKSFKEDSRVQKIKKQPNNRPLNRGMFVPDGPEEYFYEDKINPVDDILDARDLRLKNISGFKIDNSKFEPRTDPFMDPGIELESYNRMGSQYRIGSEYDMPYSNFKSDVSDKINNKNKKQVTKDTLSSIGRDLSNESYSDNNYNNYNNKNKKHSYGKIDKPVYSSETTMDTGTKMVIPNMATRDKRGLSTHNYTFGMVDSELRDTDFESNLIRGMPSNTKKSYGYRNPADHYYQYIDNDFQNADNSVEAYPRGGEGTRSINKSMVRQKHTREIL